MSFVLDRQYIQQSQCGEKPYVCCPPGDVSPYALSSNIQTIQFPSVVESPVINTNKPFQTEMILPEPGEFV